MNTYTTLGPQVRDPHLELSPRTVAAADAAARVLQGVQRVALPVAVATDAWRVADAVQADGGTLGPETGRATFDIAGGWAGAGAGAWGLGQVGAVVGATVCTPVPIVGTVACGAVGGVVGGVAGGIVGGIVGSGIGQAVFDFLWND